MGYIGNEPTTGHFPVDNFTSSGGSTYTLAKAPASAGAIEVSVQGVLQPTTAYTVSGTTLTMAGVTTGVKIFVRHLGETLVLPTIADGVVTAAKMATNSVDGTKIAMGSDAQGDILYHGATDYARLPKGTASQTLKMNAGATAPEWVTVSTPTAITIGTEQATTSGSYFTFGSIPSGTKRVYMIFEQVDISGSDHWLIQIGDAGGIETSGYISTGTSVTAANVVANVSSTAGFAMHNNSGASSTLTGVHCIELTDSTNNTWIGHGTLKSHTNQHVFGAGSKSLSAELTQIKLDTTGSNTFTAGSVNITYE